MPITILHQVNDTYEGEQQWEVEQNGLVSYLTLAQIKTLMGA